MKSKPTLDLFIQKLPQGAKVLDIGCGHHQDYAKAMRAAGFLVHTIDRNHEADIPKIYPVPLQDKYEGIWCSHVLEHQPNPNMFLKHLFNDLVDDGWLAITVPPWRDQIVGGHVTAWNAGLLLYQLILAGFNCAKASVATYGYNVSVVVQKCEAVLPELGFCNGDLEKLNEFFPVEAKQGFGGTIDKVNWG